MTQAAAPKAETPAKVSDKSPAHVVSDKPLHDLVYQFKVSRRAGGNFRNLWQLVVKTPSVPQPMELVDADLLSTVIDKIRLVFEEDGL